MFLQAEIAASAGLGVVSPDPGGRLLGGRAAPLLSCGGEHRARGDECGGGEAFRGPSALDVDAVRQGRQHRQTLTGPLIDAGFAVRAVLFPQHLLVPDGAWGGPHTPAGGVVHRPLREVEVEGPHHGQVVDPSVRPQRLDLDDLPAGGVLAAGRLPCDPVFPRGRDVGRQAQRVDSRVVGLQVFPKQLAQAERQRSQRGEVQRRLAFPQVVHQHVADGPAGDVVAVDHLLDGDLPLGLAADGADCRWGSIGECAHRVQQLVEVRARVAPAPAQQQFGHLDAVPGGDVANHAALGGHHGGDPAQCAVFGVGVRGVLAANRDQLREPFRVAAAGHLNGQHLHRPRRQKPRQARPDHITADQHENGAAQGVEVVLLPCAGRAVAPQPPDYAVPPSDVAGRVGAADQPPVLPSPPGMVLQPAQDLSDAGATAGLRAGSVEDKRRREQPR
jgi:hypothetical protein